MRQRRCRTRSTACARSRKVNDPAERAHLLSAGRELLRVSDVCGSGFGKRIAAHQAACPVKAQLAAHRTGDTDLEVLLDIGRLVADGLHRLLQLLLRDAELLRPVAQFIVLSATTTSTLVDRNS